LGISPDIKRQALQLYLEGLGFRSIRRFLKCSHIAVYNWIKAHGESIELLHFGNDIEVVELDEMHTNIGSKKTIAGSGLLLIAMESNSSTAKWVSATQQQEKAMERYQRQKHECCDE
jgi:transposase